MVSADHVSRGSPAARPRPRGDRGRGERRGRYAVPPLRRRAPRPIPIVLAIDVECSRADVRAHARRPTSARLLGGGARLRDFAADRRRPVHDRRGPPARCLRRAAAARGVRAAWTGSRSTPGRRQAPIADGRVLDRAGARGPSAMIGPDERLLVVDQPDRRRTGEAGRRPGRPGQRRRPSRRSPSSTGHASARPAGTVVTIGAC